MPICFIRMLNIAFLYPHVTLIVVGAVGVVDVVVDVAVVAVVAVDVVVVSQILSSLVSSLSWRNKQTRKGATNVDHLLRSQSLLLLLLL